MKTRNIIYADEGKILTNGKIYGTKIYLADGMTAEEFYEISVEEYEKMLAEMSERICSAAE